MINDIIIRKEKPVDVSGIRAVNEAVFSKRTEAQLVDQLRAEIAAEDYLSLVAVYESDVVGHILFTPVTIIQNQNKNNYKWCGLAPMAVEPSYQDRGIGSNLVVKGMQMVATKGFDGVVVLGYPEYYQKFGFQPAYNFAITCNFEVPKDAFMVKAITKGALDGSSGLVKYHDLFEKL